MFNILFSLFFIFQIYVISRFLRKREYTKATLYTIFSILFYIFVIWYTNYCEKVETFVLDTKIDGPNILIIAGTHGNESGPCVGLEELINLFVKNNINLKKGKLTIIPTINKCGRKLNLRFQPHKVLNLDFTNWDINRNYASKKGEEGSCDISNKIQSLIKKADYILDFHEGYDFNKLNPSSMGQTLYPGLIGNSKQVAIKIKDKINHSMKAKGETKDYKYYDVVDGWPEINGSLRKFANLNNKPYILVEIAGQNKNQTLKEKVDQTTGLCLAF